MSANVAPRLRAFAAGALIVTAAAAYLPAAPPRIILLDGGPLAGRVYLIDLQENERLVLSLAPSPAGVRDTATVIQVAFFHSSLRWGRTARDKAALRALRMEDADERGVLLVSRDGDTAVIDHGRATRRPQRFSLVQNAGREILKAYDVPLP